MLKYLVFQICFVFLIMRKQEADNNDPKAFEIEMDDHLAQVSVHTIKSAKVFHLVFNSRRAALNITVATDDDGGKFWASLPEGRQEEAELAGKAIAAYLREYRRIQACAITTVKKLATPSLFD
jgi:hypothetical protein